ncbi:MAG: hypothetical protein EBY16_02730 [Gammaproteobacteria bacterium]|nr:hypothetical protein [Gammaproteobacteria bacterium]
MEFMSVFYNNEHLYAVIKEQDQIKLFRKQDPASVIWELLPQKEYTNGLWVRDAHDAKAYFDINGNQLRHIRQAGHALHYVEDGKQQQQKKKSIIAEIEGTLSTTFVTKFETLNIERRRLDLEGPTIIAEIVAQQKQEDMVRKMRILRLADTAEVDDFLAMVKKDIISHLAVIADLEPAEISALISALIANRSFTIRDSEAISTDLRNSWLFDYDFIAKQLLTFPNKTIGAYQHAVFSKLVDILAEFDELIERPNLETSISKIHGLKHASEYWISKLNLGGHIATIPDSEQRLAVIIEALNRIEPELTPIVQSCNPSQKRELVYIMSKRFDCDKQGFFFLLQAHYPAWGLDARAIDDAPQQEEPVLNEVLTAFTNSYRQTACPPYLFQWMWDVCDYVYRLCAWMDTYCLGLGEANELSKCDEGNSMEAFRAAIWTR